MPVAETVCGDNIVGLVSPAIAQRSEVLRSDFVPEGSVVRYAKEFAEGLNTINPHRLTTIVTKAPLPLHSCFTVVDQLASHDFTSLVLRVWVEADVQQLLLQLPLSWKLFACTRQYLVRCYSAVSCRQCSYNYTPQPEATSWCAVCSRTCPEES
jgi:hypothetical protein